MTASLAAIRWTLRPMGITQHLSGAVFAASTGFSLDQFLGTTAGVVGAIVAAGGLWIAYRTNSRNIRASAAQERRDADQRVREEERAVAQIRLDNERSAAQTRLDLLTMELERRDREIDRTARENEALRQALLSRTVMPFLPPEQP